MTVCAVCTAPSEKKCSFCQNVFYCSREHQKQDWKNHKPKCYPYKIKESPELGRHLVAVRKINAGHEILRETALVSGPMQRTPPICLGCYKLLTSFNSIECPKCGWPMCSLECARAPQHLPECRITTQCRGSKVKIQTFELPHPSYECLAVLRCLYMKKDKPTQWKKLMNMQSHCDERKQSEQYDIEKANISKFIFDFFKVTDFTEDEILRVAGIFNINGHEVPTNCHDIVSVFETASYLEHNCRANCSKSFTSAGDLVIRAATMIEPDEHLSICYTDPLWGTQNRRQHLLETKFFNCVCKRCSDPTEFGSHFDSIKCPIGGCKGYIIMTNPLSPVTSWSCSTCDSQRSHEEMGPILAEASNILMSSDKNNLSSLMSCIEKLGKILHPNNYLITDAKMSVTQLLEDDVNQLSDEELSVKLQFCRQLHKLTKNLVPAENRCLGVLLFGLHAALAETGRRKSNAGEFDQNDLKNNILECKNILTESYRLLRHEPDVLPEGQIALQARTNLLEIEEILHTLHRTMGDAPL